MKQKGRNKHLYRRKQKNHETTIDNIMSEDKVDKNAQINGHLEKSYIPCFNNKDYLIHNIFGCAITR